MLPSYYFVLAGFHVFGLTTMASSYGGMSWGILFVFYTLPFVAIPVIATMVLAAFSAFKHPMVFYPYAGVMTLVALFFLAMAAKAPGSAEGSLLVVAEVAVVYLLTVVPAYSQFKPRSGGEQGGPQAHE